MTVTLGEKRKVARRLRDIDIDDFSCYAQEYEVLCKAIGLGDYDTDWTNRLADLIEPEPERTCQMDLTDVESDRTVRIWECSECGMSNEEVYGDYEFCPHCRARVVK